MTHTHKRCKHCQTQYTWQGSGNGCFHELNDDRYCPDCKQVIVEALKSVSKKYKKQFVETNEVTYEYLKAERAKQDAKSGLCCRRVYASLSGFDGTREINDAYDVGGKQYLVQYWNDKPEEFKIKVLMEINIETGETGKFWKDF